MVKGKRIVIRRGVLERTPPTPDTIRGPKRAISFADIPGSDRWGLSTFGELPIGAVFMHAGSFWVKILDTTACAAEELSGTGTIFPARLVVNTNNALEMAEPPETFGALPIGTVFTYLGSFWIKRDRAHAHPIENAVDLTYFDPRAVVNR